MCGTCCGDDEDDSRRRGRNDPRVSPEQLIASNSGNVRIKPQKIISLKGVAKTTENKFKKSFSQSTSSRDSDETLAINRTCTDVTFLILGIAFVIVLVSGEVIDNFLFKLFNFSREGLKVLCKNYLSFEFCMD